MSEIAWGIKTHAHAFKHSDTCIRLYRIRPSKLCGYRHPFERIFGGIWAHNSKFKKVSSRCAGDSGAVWSPGLQLDHVRDGKYLWWFGVQNSLPSGRERVTCAMGGASALLS